VRGTAAHAYLCNVGLVFAASLLPLLDLELLRTVQVVEECGRVRSCVSVAEASQAELDRLHAIDIIPVLALSDVDGRYLKPPGCRSPPMVVVPAGSAG
jgi:hypothetical protein